MALIRRRENQEQPTAARSWDPFQMMNELMRWDPFHDGSFGSPLRRAALAEWTPAFDVRETGESYVVSADMPGLEEENLELSLTGNRLTISGKREEERRNEGDRVHMYERSYGAFSRSFQLPDGVDTDHIEAHLDKGVLKVTIPKKPEVKPRKISIGNLLKSSNKA